MLDPKFIRENQQAVRHAIENKKCEKVDLDKYLKLDEEAGKLQKIVEEARSRRNEISEKIGAADPENRENLIKEAGEIKEELQKLEEDYEKVQAELEEIHLKIPNVVSPNMPVGEDDSENVAVRKWGEPKQFDFKPSDHVDLGVALDIIDTEKAAQVSGTRFYYLKNEAVVLQFAIIQFVLKTLTDEKVLGEIADKTGNPYSKPFSPVVPPILMRPEVMKKMDRLDPIDERYRTVQDNLVMVGSAEHTLGPIHMDEIFEKEDLPIRYIGYSTALRREAGSYGKDTRGIFRVHQFDKLEMETFVPEEYGEVEQEFIVGIQEYMMQQFGIPYQIMQICTGDCGKPDYNQYDVEAWLPGQGKYRETHTSDYMTDYQARRLNIRYRDDNDKKFVHMNDATGFAIGRILIAILENFQQEDGSVIVPEVLRGWAGIERISA
ncbi:serine--tRNA ligase [Candidatus Dojkabacteria bacterium]|nr:serine--tRNA ligase [Candidatus Dojkabacteria bacterium]